MKDSGYASPPQNLTPKQRVLRRDPTAKVFWRAGAAAYSQVCYVRFTNKAGDFRYTNDHHLPRQAWEEAAGKIT